MMVMPALMGTVVGGKGSVLERLSRVKMMRGNVGHLGPVMGQILAPLRILLLGLVVMMVSFVPSMTFVMGKVCAVVRRSCVRVTSEPVGRQEHATAQVIAGWRFQGRRLLAMTMTFAHSAMRAMEQGDVLGRRLSVKTRTRFAVLSLHATARVPVA